MKFAGYILIIPVLLFCGCKVKELAPADYMSWVKNKANGLRVSKTLNDHEFSVQYKPTEYEALLHMNKDDVSKQRLDSAKATINELQYFTFCIVSPDKKDPASGVATDEADYYQRLNYMMFEMQQNFQLIDGNDTLPCVMYHYERNYDVSPDNNFLLGFELPKTKNTAGNKTLIYDDQLLGTGTVMLTVKAEDIESIPTIKLSN